MADSQTLANLRDIQLPTPITWWPLAFGWYILAGIIVVSIALVTVFAYKKWLNNRAKRQALVLLASYHQQYLRGENSQSVSANLSELLRRVALVYYPRQHVASLQGEAWVDFLNKTSKHLDFKAVRVGLLELPYQHDAKKIDLKPLFICAEKWIKQQSKPCSN